MLGKSAIDNIFDKASNSFFDIISLVEPQKVNLFINPHGYCFDIGLFSSPILREILEVYTTKLFSSNIDSIFSRYELSAKCIGGEEFKYRDLI